MWQKETNSKVWVQQKQKSDLQMWFESCLSKKYLSDKYFQKYVRKVLQYLSSNCYKC